MPDLEHRYVVLALNHQCYTEWRTRHNLSQREAIYVRSSHHLRGLHPKHITIVLVCEWTTNLTLVGLTAISEQIQMYKALGTKVVNDVCRAPKDS